MGGYLVERLRETVANDAQFIFFANVLPGIGEHIFKMKARK